MVKLGGAPETGGVVITGAAGSGTGFDGGMIGAGKVKNPGGGPSVVGAGTVVVG